MSFLDVFSQGGVQINRNLTHEDLAEDIDTINRSLSASNAVLLPPNKQNDEEFTIAFLGDKNTLNRDLSINDLEQGHEFTQVVYNNGTVSVGIKGSITFKVTTDFDYNTNWGSLQSLKFITTTTTKGQVQLFTNGGFTTNDI